MDSFEKKVVLFFIVVFGLIAFAAFNAISSHAAEAKLEKTIKVKVVGTMVYDESTRCLYDYEGKRFRTYQSGGCTALVGDTLLVNIDKNGNIVENTIRYENE